MSYLFGSLLGDAYAEKIPGKNSGTRICFQQENSNVAYLKWIYSFYSERGYTVYKLKKQIIIGKEGKIRFIYRFKTFSFFSFNI